MTKTPAQAAPKLDLLDRLSGKKPNLDDPLTTTRYGVTVIDCEKLLRLENVKRDLAAAARFQTAPLESDACPGATLPEGK